MSVRFWLPMMTPRVDERFLRTMADAVPGLIAHWDRDLRCTFANRQYVRWFGRPLDEIVGADMQGVLGNETFALARPHVDAALLGVEARFDRVVVKFDGTVAHVWVSYVPHRDEGGAVLGFFVLVIDVMPLREGGGRASEGEGHYRLLADHSRDMIFHLDRDLVRRYASPACREILGYEPHEIVGVRPMTQIHPEDAERVAAVFRSLLDGGVEQASVINRIRHRDGRWVWVEVAFRAVKDPWNGSSTGIVGTMRDISSRKEAEARLAEAHRQLGEMARRDALTGLVNRRGLDDLLSRLSLQARDVGGASSLIMVDVDRFKSFNDRHGHLAGDACLRRVAEAIEASVRYPHDVAARFGGEEFAVLLPGTDEAGAALVAERVREAVARLALPHDASPDGVVTVSAGIACVRGEAVDVGCEDLLRSADRALYAAKGAGRNRIVMASSLGHSGECAPSPLEG